MPRLAPVTSMTPWRHAPAVSTIGLPLVTMTVCSNCATRLPSVVHSVQPSSPSTADVALGGEERLDGDHEALPEHRAVAVVLDARHARRLADVAPDAVAAEVRDDREAVAAGPALDGPADVAQRLAGAGRVDARRGWRGGWRRAGGGRPGEARADRGAGAGVGPVAVELGRHVDVDQVAVAQPRVGEGMPCAASSLTLTHVAAGKP